MSERYTITLRATFEGDANQANDVCRDLEASAEIDAGCIKAHAEAEEIVDAR